MTNTPRLVLMSVFLILGSTGVLHADEAPPAPLFVDPNYHGSCDPEVVWNPADQRWYLYYTARRATRESASYVGTPIGVISSADLKDWSFDGYCDFSDSSEIKHVGQPDMAVTFWAPGITRNGDTLHMFVTYKDNAKPPWAGKGEIRHYTTSASDPIDGWTLVEPPNFNQPDPIDATIVFDDETGKHRAYYRVGKGGGIQWATSDDLMTWNNQGKVKGDVNTLGKKRYGYQEAPYVFRFNGAWWMLTDPHRGLAVYRSDDGVSWVYNNNILAKGSDRALDATMARHPSVVIHDGRALMFYHCEPNRLYGKGSPGAEQRTTHQKKSVLQIAELKVLDQKLVATREVQLP